MLFIIRDRETGTVIEEATTREEALEIIRQYEEEDKAEGNYTEDFYEVVMSEAEFNAYVNMMDDEIREDVHMDLAPCTIEEFYNEYQKRHIAKYGEELEI